MADSLDARLRDVVTRSGADVHAALQEFREADDRETRILADEDLAFDRGLRSVRAHLDPRQPHQIVESVSAGLFANQCNLNSLASPPFMFLARSKDGNSLLILEFGGLTPETRHIAVIDMQMDSTEGGVRISATNNPAWSLVTHERTGGAQVSVPVAFTTRDDGGALLLFVLDDGAECFWFGTDIFSG
jgi:hypothetical protein